MSAVTGIILLILLTNTIFLALIYFDFGARFRRAEKALEVAQGFQHLAAGQVRQTHSVVQEVLPEKVKQAIRQAVAEASNGGSSVLSGEIHLHPPESPGSGIITTEEHP